MATMRDGDPAPAAIAKPAILLIDDERDNLDLLRRTLHRDFKVHTAESGPEGLEILRREPVEIILADHCMPGMTGVEFLAEALKLQPQSKRVILTGYAQVDSVIDANNTGRVHYFIRKPWDNGQLSATLDQLLELARL